MRYVHILVIILIIVPGGVCAAWEPIAPGMELGRFPIKKTGTVAHPPIVVVRIDPDLWELVLIGKSWNNKLENYTVKEWCKKQNLTAAINAGMFATDYLTHVGYLSSKGHVNNSHVNKYMSVAAFDPKKGKNLPKFRIFDLDDPKVTMETIRRDYSSVVQNLRLIKRPGENRWKQQGKMWSEAALGEDSAGRILFIFSRSPFSMHDFNNVLLSLGVGLVAAQHLEGGPEAQLYLRHGETEYEMFGSYEPSFNEKNDNSVAWRIPNVLAVRPRIPATQ